MELTKIECPYCGGQVIIDDNRDTCFCSYCGRQLSIKGRNSSSHKIEKTVTIRDEARIKELDLIEKENQRAEKEARKLTRKLNKEGPNYALIVFLLTLGLWIISALAVGVVDSELRASFGLLILALPIVILISLFNLFF